MRCVWWAACRKRAPENTMILSTIYFLLSTFYMAVAAERAWD